jgi:hypothetical protein
MAQRLGPWDGNRFGTVINHNADELEDVEGSIETLRLAVVGQRQEILQLRAMVIGLVDVLRSKLALADEELDRAVGAALTALQPPRSAPRSAGAAAAGHPYRDPPVEAAPVPTTVCIRCTAQVPKAETTITELGEVCDACSRGSR